MSGNWKVSPYGDAACQAVQRGVEGVANRLLPPFAFFPPRGIEARLGAPPRERPTAPSHRRCADYSRHAFGVTGGRFCNV
jgi:hypothetical protein